MIDLDQKKIILIEIAVNYYAKLFLNGIWDW